MLMQPTTIAAAQAAGSPYFWDNGQKKLAVTAEQLAQFQSGGQYDPSGGSALTQWANINTQPINPGMMQTEMITDINPTPTKPTGLLDRYTNWWDETVRPNVGGRLPQGAQDFMRDNPYFSPTLKKGAKALVEKIMPKARAESGIGVPRRLERPVREGRVAPVSYSQVAMDKIADWEGGYQDKPFDDVGTQRIGFGREYAKGEKTTEAKERGWLMGKVQDIGDWLDGVVTADLNANQKAALTSLVYNVGKGSFKKSKALKALNAGDMDEFRSQAFSKNKGWVKSKGKFLKGLYNRRMKEQALFDG